MMPLSEKAVKKKPRKKNGRSLLEGTKNGGVRWVPTGTTGNGKFSPKVEKGTAVRIPSKKL